MKYISIILIMAFLVPAVALSQEPRTPSINIDSINIDDASNAIDGTQEVFSVVQIIFDIGSEIYSVLKQIINTVDNWLQKTVGISITELIKTIFNAIVKILEVILNLIRSVLN